jgi:uncharacterized membrane protein YphA (DoxX/SURF4 family)
MKKIKIAYWIFTILLCLPILIGGVFDAISAPEAIEAMKHLGYPAYLLPFLGVAKILAVIAILVPRFPRLKEWAYAGLFFDLLGAMYSHISSGDGPDKWGFFPVAFILLFGSYIFYHKKNKAATAA